MTFLTNCSRIALGVVAASSGLLLTGCGGGGGSGSPTPTPVSTAPRFTSSATASVVENTAGTFYTATATDPQNDPIAFSIQAGPDADKFVISSTGELRFNSLPNYDLPVDVGGDNVYEVSLRALTSDGSATLNMRVTVTNDREGIAVKRVASGIVDPVDFSFVHNTPTLLIAEKAGRVLIFDPDTGSLTEDTFIRDNKQRGDILAIAFGFPDNSFQEGTYLVTYHPVDGLFLQAFNAARGTKNIVQLGGPGGGPVSASIIAQNSVYVAIGDPGGNRAQDLSSPYGKLFELPYVNPYAGASLPPPGFIVMRPSIIGDGIQRPGGFSPAADFLYLADQGSTREHELVVFRRDWRPLDFGWPFYEGSKASDPNVPAQINGPNLAYAFGDGKREGRGIVAGILNDGRFFEPLGSNYVFADVSGKIWTVSRTALNDGFLHFANEFELRTEDFEPDVGSIDSPIAFTNGFGTDHFYFLDGDGEVFRVEKAN